MDRIRVKLGRPHGFSLDEARVRLERLLASLAARFPGYNVRHEYTDEARRRVALRFEKSGRGHGTGAAALGDGRVDLEIDAQYKLPFLVPVVLAEKIVRDDISRMLDQSFGPQG